MDKRQRPDDGTIRLLDVRLSIPRFAIPTTPISQAARQQVLIPPRVDGRERCDNLRLMLIEIAPWYCRYLPYGINEFLPLDPDGDASPSALSDSALLCQATRYRLGRGSWCGQNMDGVVEVGAPPSPGCGQDARG